MTSAADDDVLTYHIVDVFTDKKFSGNALAVVLGGEDLTSQQMQSLATEFHLSETAFPLWPDAEQRVEGADYRLRIFTPEVELPFAGHPSIGTAWLLRRLGLIPTGQVHQLCGEGLLRLDVTDDAVTLTGGQPRLSEPIDPSLMLAAVGLDSADLAGHPPRIASTGLEFAILPVRDDALGRCRADMELLRSVFSYPNDATGVYVVAWDKGVRHARARMFAGDIGVAEDPATGSAALALGVYLGGTGLLPVGSSVIDVVQGVEMGRPSTLRVVCEVESDGARLVQVSGGAVHVAKGRISTH